VRVIVTGGRRFNDRTAISAMLRLLDPGSDVIVHGAASGADSLAAKVAASVGFAVEPHPADWEGPCRPTCGEGHRRHRSGGSYCPAAGNYRNHEMAEAGAGLCVAFPGGSGTADMCRAAKAAGIEVRWWPTWPL